VTTFTVQAVPGIGEVTAGADLAALLLDHVSLEEGDVVVVTSKVVSKAEGRVVRASKAEALLAETDRLVARRGETTIVRTRHGLVMAGAGIDASNTAPGTLVLLPEDPDRSAQELRARLQELSGQTVGVVVSDTSGRAWRTGQTDIAVGAAGLRVLDDHAGRTDAYGNVLVVTAPAHADELAAAGDLAKGKLAMSPVAVVRGLGSLVLPAGEDGPGAAALVRDEGSDMFGLGAREAVLQALTGGDVRGFGSPAPVEPLVAAVQAVVGEHVTVVAAAGAEVVIALTAPDQRTAGLVEGRLEAVARAHGWTSRNAGSTDRVILHPRLP
jgi:coenzyme F420-0:L-glutamate ligase/coenzyme F420-1:gamma-L-glutamate ligase